MQLRVRLLETTITGASHVIINISGDISLMDANDAASYVQDLAGDDANIIFGAKYDETKTDEATITVIATGLEAAAPAPKMMTGMSGMGLKYASSKPSARPVTGGLGTRPVSGATAAGGTTTAPAGGFMSGIQKPKRPESTVQEKDIKIPEFLKNTRK